MSHTLSANYLMIKAYQQPLVIILQLQRLNVAFGDEIFESKHNN